MQILDFVLGGEVYGVTFVTNSPVVYRVDDVLGEFSGAINLLRLLHVFLDAFTEVSNAVLDFTHLLKVGLCFLSLFAALGVGHTCTFYEGCEVMLDGIRLVPGCALSSCSLCAR